MTGEDVLVVALLNLTCEGFSVVLLPARFLLPLGHVLLPQLLQMCHSLRILRLPQIRLVVRRASWLRTVEQILGRLGGCMLQRGRAITPRHLVSTLA
jgi:hypothetical protein